MRPQAIGAMPRPRIRVSRGVAGESDVLSSLRRRTGRVRWARRRRLARWLRPFLAALAIVAAPALAGVWLATSPRFAVGELTVASGERVPEPWVRLTLAPILGENLPLLPLARVEQLLRDHPWILGADLRKDLPARLVVRLTERQAVAILRAGADLYYVDSGGERIAAFDPTAPVVDLPLISVSSAPGAEDGSRSEAAILSGAVRLLAEIEEVAPTWASGLSEIEILGEEDFRVHSATLNVPLLVRTGTLNLKARRLEELLPHIVERYGAAAAIDLRFARRIIVQPFVETGGEPRRPAPAAEHRKATADHVQRG